MTETEMIHIMSIYDNRIPIGSPKNAPPKQWSKNKYILKWWTKSHDGLVYEAIKKYEWLWEEYDLLKQLTKVTPAELLDTWKTEDPLCSQYAWYNVLLGFAASRADCLGYLEMMREPTWKICPICKEKFNEYSVPGAFIKRLDINQIDICSPCFADALYHPEDTFEFHKKKTFTKKDTLAFKEILFSHVKQLADTLGKVPPQDYGVNSVPDLRGYSTEDRIKILGLLKKRPNMSLVKILYGSWLEFLIAAEIIEHGAYRAGRGIRCLAIDGHVCFSLGEKTIDDFLFQNAIKHDKEPPYPSGKYRADFLIDNIFVEYFGFIGNKEYDAKTALKKELCKKYKIKLIEIYPSDIINLSKLQKLFRNFL